MSDLDWRVHFSRGEKLLWQGAPVTGQRAKPDQNMIKAGVTTLLLCLGLGAVAQFGGLSGVKLTVLYIIMAVLMIIAAYAVFIEPFLILRGRKDARYAITNKRALMLKLPKSPKAMALFEMRLTVGTRIHLDQGPPATLTLWQEPESRNKDAQAAVLKFSNLENGDEAYQILRALLQEMK